MHALSLSMCKQQSLWVKGKNASNSEPALFALAPWTMKQQTERFLPMTDISFKHKTKFTKSIQKIPPSYLPEEPHNSSFKILIINHVVRYFLLYHKLTLTSKARMFA